MLDGHARLTRCLSSFLCRVLQHQVVRAQVALLFRNQRDLLEEFTYFLPDSTAPQQVLAMALHVCGLKPLPFTSYPSTSCMV